MKDSMFEEALSEAELFAWQSLKSIVTNFLGIEELQESFRQLEEQMSVKFYFQHSHFV